MERSFQTRKTSLAKLNPPYLQSCPQSDLSTCTNLLQKSALLARFLCHSKVLETLAINMTSGSSSLVPISGIAYKLQRLSLMPYCLSKVELFNLYTSFAKLKPSSQVTLKDMKLRLNCLDRTNIRLGSYIAEKLIRQHKSYHADIVPEEERGFVNYSKRWEDSISSFITNRFFTALSIQVYSMSRMMQEDSASDYVLKSLIMLIHNMILLSQCFIGANFSLVTSSHSMYLDLPQTSG